MGFKAWYLFSLVESTAGMVHVAQSLTQFVKLMRPHQYIKNLFVLAPLFFALKFDDWTAMSRGLAAFAAFCLTASAVYILNDFLDVEADRKHPKKRYRPLASGAVRPGHALVLMALLAMTGLLTGLAVSNQVAGLLLVYIAMNLAYSFGLKRVSIVDIGIIAGGFVVRLFAGGLAGEVPLSFWIIIITYLLALFLALAKRRDDVILYLRDGTKMREVVDGYNLEFLNGAMVALSAVVMVCYIMYTISAEVVARVASTNLYITTLFVLMGLLRYMQLTFVRNLSDSPTAILLTDRFLQVVILAWVISFALIIY